MIKKSFFCLIFLFFLSLPAVAAAAQDKQQSLNALEKDLAAQKSLETKLAAQEETLQKDVRKLRQILIKTAEKARAQENTLTAVEKNIAELRRQEKQRTANLAEEQKALGELVVALERLARLPPEALLARPDEPVKAARGTMLIRSALPRIQEQTEALQTELDALGLLRKELAIKLVEEKKTRDRLKEDEAEINELMDKRRSFLALTAQQRARQTAEVENLAKQARNMRDLVQKIEREADNAALSTAPAIKQPRPQTGKFLLPVAGDIRTDYGETDELGATSRGITISGHSGATVVSPMAGIIRFAGPFQGKQILIVDHRDGYHSLMTGLSRIDTAVGESVATGEPVGRLAAAASSSDTRLYFELRHNGKPINPAPVLSANKK